MVRCCLTEVERSGFNGYMVNNNGLIVVYWIDIDYPDFTSCIGEGCEGSPTLTTRLLKIIFFIGDNGD